MKHTPGPWKVEICTGCGNYEIHAEVTVEEMSSSDATVSETSVLQAHFISSCFDGAVKIEADAILIAAAPELLEVAQWIQPYIRDMRRRKIIEIPDLALDALEIVIAKATGA